MRPGVPRLLPLVAATAILLLGCGTNERGIPVELQDAVRSAIRTEIHTAGKRLELTDPRNGQTVEMEFNHLDKEVRKTRGGRYVTSAEYHGKDRTVYRVDYYVDKTDGHFEIEDVVMHRAGEQEVIPRVRHNRLEAKR